MTPPRHSNTIVFGAGRTVPVKSMPAGRKIVWSANRVMSNPLSAPEFWMNTETRSWVPCTPVITAGLDEQGVVPDGIMHTIPIPELVTMTLTVVV